MKLKKRKGTILGECGTAILVITVILILIGPCVYEFNRRHVNGNQKMFDTNWNFKYADVHFPDGTTKTIEIKTWNDYEGEQIQLESTDGTVYLVSSFNTVLRSK